MQNGPLSPAGRQEILNPEQLERKIVVGLFERPREVLEVVAAGAGGCCLAPGGCGRAAAAAPLAIVVALSAATAAEHQHLAHVDLGAVAGLVVLVLPLAILDPSFDEDLVPLLTVLLHDVRKAGAFGVPDHAAVPLGLLLFLTIRRVPLPARGKRESCDSVAARCRPHFRIAAQVSDQHHLVKTSAHFASWRESSFPAANSIERGRAPGKPTISPVSKTAR